MPAKRLIFLWLCLGGQQFWRPSAGQPGPILPFLHPSSRPRLPRTHRTPSHLRGGIGAICPDPARRWRPNLRSSPGRRDPFLPSTWATAPGGSARLSLGQGFYCERSSPPPSLSGKWGGWAGTRSRDFANSAEVPG